MPTWYDGTETQKRALNAYITLMRAAGSVSAKIHAPLAGLGLTEGQFAALEALHHLGPMRQNELAAKLLSSPGNLSILLSNLERGRLVRRRKDASDARCTVVAITARGGEVIKRIFPAHVARLVQAMSSLSPAEQEHLRALCRKLGRGAH